MSTPGTAAPELVIFDCDGVLVDSERLVVGVEARVLTDLGWPHTVEQVVARWMGRSSASQLAEIEARIGPEEAARFDALTTQAADAAFARELTAVLGVEELLDHLDAVGLPVCVASSGTHDRMRQTLGLTGLWDRFEGRIFSATEVARGKPDPDLFIHAARQMGARPNRCAVVEDSVYGVQAAVRAGMQVYGYAGGLTAEQQLRDAGATVVHEMRDLVAVLGGPAAGRSDDRGA